MRLTHRMLATTVVVMGTRPGTVNLEIDVEQDLPRPRDLNSPDLVRLAAEITRALKSHLPGAAPAEAEVA